MNRMNVEIVYANSHHEYCPYCLEPFFSYGLTCRIIQGKYLYHVNCIRQIPDKKKWWWEIRYYFICQYGTVSGLYDIFVDLEDKINDQNKEMWSEFTKRNVCDLTKTEIKKQDFLAV